MKLSVSHPSHSPWKSPSAVISHIPTATTTTHYDDNLALQKRRHFSFAPTWDYFLTVRDMPTRLEQKFAYPLLAPACKVPRAEAHDEKR